MRKIIGVLLAAAGICLPLLLLDHLYPVDLSASKKVSRVVVAEEGGWLYAQTSPDEKWRFPVELNRLDPSYLRMQLAFEDHRYYSHFGVDPLAMLRAVMQMITQGRIVSGGSTITMQLARLLEPKSRTLSHKLQEILRAMQMEWHYSKQEILAAYLTLTPYGGNVEGVVGASMHYFGKLPASLSAAESALLVSLPQSPERNRPDRSAKNAAAARNKVLLVAKKQGIITERVYHQAIAQPVPTESSPFPRHAPHLSQRVLSENSGERLLRTTLDAGLQKQLERWARSKASVLGRDTTLAAMVVRNRDAAVVAYLGSHDMFSRQVSGYMDMTGAIRSPGSTLKPFIYALGIEKHLIHPNTVIRDEETRFGDYMPRNFSYQYSGDVTVAYALQHSLNIPAVKVLQRIGAEEFADHLVRSAGKIHIPRKRSTLPVALGGIGITMKQLAQLYLALANGGESHAIHCDPADKERGRVVSFCGSSAAKMTTAVLRRVPRPDGFVDLSRQIAYKTGTSYGYRDAWTFAYNASYTVAVWIGKPANASQLGRTGRNTAAPMAFEIFALLESLLPQESWGWPASYLGNTVPPGLAYFDDRKSDNSASKPRMLYPRDNDRFRSADCSDVLVEVKVEQGTEPYFWYIDGEAKKIERSDVTLPFGFGAHRITVIDSRGKSVTRSIWVDRPEC